MTALLHRIVVQRLISQGKCRQCCCVIEGDPRHPSRRKGRPTLCASCLRKAGQWNRDRRDHRLAAGVCVICGHGRDGVDAATSGTGTMCRPCSNAVNARALPRQRVRYAERKAAGLCSSCPNVRGDNGTARQCRACADRANERKRVIRAQRRA